MLNNKTSNNLNEMIFIFWILASILVGFIGSGRKIGYWGTFLLSLLLSPIIGLIFALASKRLADIEREEKLEGLARDNNRLMELTQMKLEKMNSGADVSEIVPKDFKSVYKYPGVMTNSQIKEVEDYLKLNNGVPAGKVIIYHILHQRVKFLTTDQYEKAVRNEEPLIKLEGN